MKNFKIKKTAENICAALALMLLFILFVSCNDSSKSTSDTGPSKWGNAVWGEGRWNE